MRTLNTIKTIGHIKKLTKQTLATMVGRSNTKDEITRVVQNVLHSIRAERSISQFSVEVTENNDNAFMRIEESEEIAQMVPGDQYGNSGLIIQRDHKGALVFDPTIVKKDDTLNIKINVQPTQTIDRIFVQMEVKK